MSDPVVEGAGFPVNSRGEVVVTLGSGDNVIVGSLPSNCVPVDASTQGLVLRLPTISGSGDMISSVYDPNTDGKIDYAQTTGFGTASTLDYATSGDATTSQVVKGSDSRLTDGRTPLTHSHPISDISNLSTTLSAKVDKDGTKVLSDENFTITEKTKLGNLTDNFKGYFASATARDTSVTTPQLGYYCLQEDTNSIWYYSSSNTWINTGSTSIGNMLKSVYDPTAKNADAFNMGNMDEATDAKVMTAAERTKLSGIATGATKISSSDDVTEGGINIFFTSERVRNTLLNTGLDVSGTTAIVSTDSLLTSVGKLQGQINKHKTDLVNHENIVVNTSGQLGLGTSPSAWSSSFKVYGLSTGSLHESSDGLLRMCSGAYSDGTNWRYTSTGVKVLAYAQNPVSGIHSWAHAAAGTAGSTFSYVTLMQLNTSGRLLLGATDDGVTTLQVGGALTVSDKATTRTNLGAGTTGSTLFTSATTSAALTTLGLREPSTGVLGVNSGISFPSTQVASSDVNTLDDYEEGVFTPTLNNFNGTLLSSGCHYTKIGRVVHVWGVLVPATTFTTTLAVSYLSGLPFNPLSDGPIVHWAAGYSGIGSSIVVSNKFYAPAMSSSSANLYFSCTYNV